MNRPPFIDCQKTKVTTTRRNNFAMSEPKMDKLVVLARGLGTRMRRSDAGAAVDQASGRRGR